MDFQIENVGPQLSEILAIVIPAHLVKVYNNYASTLIVYKVNRHISFLPNECICFEVELQKCLLIMSRRCFKKKQQVTRHYHFFYVSTNVKWKTCSFYYFFSLAIVVCSPSMFFYETNFPYEGGHSIAHSIFQTCAHFLKRMKPAYMLDIKHTVNFTWKISPIASDDWV